MTLFAMLVGKVADAERGVKLVNEREIKRVEA